MSFSNSDPTYTNLDPDGYNGAGPVVPGYTVTPPAPFSGPQLCSLPASMFSFEGKSFFEN
jgi:hypothetical protein